MPLSPEKKFFDLLVFEEVAYLRGFVVYIVLLFGCEVVAAAFLSLVVLRYLVLSLHLPLPPLPLLLVVVVSVVVAAAAQQLRAIQRHLLLLILLPVLVALTRNLQQKNHYQKSASYHIILKIKMTSNHVIAVKI